MTQKTQRPEDHSDIKTKSGSADAKPASDRGSEAADRRAEALRANLRRRKDQSRARRQAEPDD